MSILLYNMVTLFLHHQADLILAAMLDGDYNEDEGSQYQKDGGETGEGFPPLWRNDA